MKTVTLLLALAGIGFWLAGCLSTSGLQQNPTISTNASLPAVTGTPTCPEAMAVIKAFYDANDAAQFDASLSLLTPDATLVTWSEGVNGRHWQETHLSGAAQIRPKLGDRGFRRTTGKPDTPIYHEREAVISGDQVTFMLRPDRLSPQGKPYNPYRISVVFAACKIKFLTVVELISWE